MSATFFVRLFETFLLFFWGLCFVVEFVANAFVLQLVFVAYSA